jgi:trimethylamine-N-oxide reductase cytochrome c-type subunit TorC
MSDADTTADVAVPTSKAKPFSLARLIAEWLAFVRTHKLALSIAGSVIGLFLIVTLSTVAVSIQPGFCINCHEIRPAYDQWRVSSHYGVTCLNCHAEPGLGGYIKVNTAGAQHLLTHLTSDYRVPAEADVHDASCLSCHPRESRPEASVRTTLRVAHSKHDKQQCADCHGRLVHVNGAGEVSAAPKPHDVRDCTVCHTTVAEPHGDATLACTSCHSGIIPKHEPARERGVMPRESCQECHQKNKVGSPEYCQTCHVSPHGVSVPCSRCHTSKTTWTEHTFNHPVPLVGKHTGLDCGKCHGTKSLTGLKYVCSNCHTPPTAHPGTIQGKTGDCATCHSPEGWKPAKIASPSSHTFPQDHKGAGGNCTLCHPQGNTSTVNCYTCHQQTVIDPKHAAKGLTSIGTFCAKCHPAGKKP